MGKDILLRTNLAAAHLELAPATLEAWRCRGCGPVFIKLGKAVRYRLSDLDEFTDRRAQTSTSRIDGKEK